ncbi:hypothetical protein U9M48_011420 [Paspalum notatum var. saurae]|uniref:NB-ARC domain-containing protein n=1 Tax=Paspalum notatum var. saurae TaxID=547442 RepID=A0AAQ3SVQ1_PASNO
MGRQITNPAMLLQLDMLRGAMHRGYYMLDSFRYQTPDNEDAKHQAGSQSLSLSKVNFLNYFCSSKRETQRFEQLQEVLESLNNMIFDANEFVIFLKTYPRMCRQPYSMHLLLGNCMFDRKVETELVISFLLQTNSPCTEELEVLPIVGPGRVGKSTLVAHVCNAERIRDHFSEILFLTDHDFRDKMLSVHSQGNATEHHICTTGKHGRLLVIVEVAGDVAEDAWKRLCSAFRRYTTNGTKIIIASRFDMVKKFETTRAITLTCPSSEAYWYFFKTLTLGSTDPEQHPRFAYVAMEIATMLNNTSLLGANITATLLRDNFDISFWCKVLVFMRGMIQKHIAKFGEHPSDLLVQNKPARLGRMMGRASEDFMVCDQYHRSSQEAVPDITLSDVMYGSAKRRGTFEVLVWRSRIPPYDNYIYTIQVLDQETKAAKRKRSQINGSPQMEMLVSVALGEAVTRSINFFTSKYSKQQAQDLEDRLCRILLRAQVIIDEAMGRQIKNQAMLLQLDMLRGAMHRGYYMLDSFRYQSRDKEDAKDQSVSPSFSLSKVSPSRYLCSSTRKAELFEQMQEAVQILNNLIFDSNELVIFLKSYPRMCRQPYSMHLMLANCMFDRKVEIELVISFLLQTKSHHVEELDVLPIVGPGKVGKSTLVAHVCRDDRIRDHFSEIVFLTDHDFKDEMLSVHSQGNATEHHICTARKDGRLLVVVEVAGDVNEDAWKRLCSAFRRSATNGTKIIITSRSDMVKKLGTTGAVTLAYPSSEAYWYFFKTLAFGSTDPEQHPRLASVAMEIARAVGRINFIAANRTASFLHDNFDINFWYKFLVFARGLIQKHIANFGEHPGDLLTQKKPAHLERMMGRASEDFMVCDQYHRSSQEAVPNITLDDVMYGSVKPHGNFEVLAWRSRMPPYYNYIYSCRIIDLKTKAAKRKRSQNNGFLVLAWSKLDFKSSTGYLSSSCNTAQDVEDHLCRVLLQAQVIIDEAMGRQITNRAMLLQLDMLRGAMHRGYYMLDSFRYQTPDKEDAKHQAGSQSLSLSKINSLNYFCSSKRETQHFEQLQEVLESLNNMIFDANEFVISLKTYPCMCRQPYSMHLLLGNCMFDLKVETELVISFLLQTNSPCTEERESRKSTLVAHVCNDERIQDHFSEILFLTDRDFRDKMLSVHSQGNATEHHICTAGKHGRLLVTVEVAGDVAEDAWKRLSSAFRQYTMNGTKIIITSWSDMVKKLGTKGAHIGIFFKTLAFGSTDPEQHPSLASVALKIARMLSITTLLGANITATLLRDNFDISFWCKVLVFIRGMIQKHVAKFGEHPSDLLAQNKPARLGRMMGTTSEDFMVCDQYHRSSQEAVQFSATASSAGALPLRWPEMRRHPPTTYSIKFGVAGSPRASGSARRRVGRTGAGGALLISNISSLSILSSNLCDHPEHSPKMEMIVSAVLGEAITRSINFLISKYSKSQAQGVEDHLRRVLLRAQVIIEEAMGRQITNQAMLLQLDMLRGAMHRGYYMLDIFRYQSHDKEDAKDQAVSQSLPLQKVNSSKYFCSSKRKEQVFKKLQEMLESLNNMIFDANEFIIFLESFPRMWRQPYSMHILLTNCMFDRKIETELVISFLLQTKSHCAEELEVLPIVGPGRVGKSTIIAHVCNDERIRDHFSEIVFLTDHDFRDEMLSVHIQGNAMEHQICTAGKDRRLLVVVEVAGDVTEDAWKQLCSAFRRSRMNGTKIIIASRFDMVKKFGTTGAITLTCPSSEAYWYFFKTLAFGSTDPEQHPRFASVAMEIATMLNNTSLLSANITANLLRDNFDISFWWKVLVFIRGLIQKHIAKFGEHPWDLLLQNKPARLGRMMGRASEDLMVCAHHHRSSQEAVPDITLNDVMYGGVKAHGKFEVLLWRSRIPPYYNYINTCQVLDLKTKAAKRKRSQNNGITP